uniref:Uncharacterized protein n=2 Tax=Rhodobryum laxelimbatum TaxID=576390 RepID=A0A7T6Y9X6_9BRYO|nr:hypothetical protein KYV50_pgp041 [Rhodobryum laxelimbatum]QQK56270.1 hypothetical protein [Rhodobryum laxelimbatum]
MKFNLGFFYLYNMIIISLEIEYFEYYYIFPLLKEILNYYGYTLNFNYLKKLTQQVLINTSQLTKWGGGVYKYFNKIYYNKKNLMIVKKKNLKIYSRLETKIYIEKFITNQTYLLIKNNYYLYKYKKKKKLEKNIYKNKKLPKKNFLYFVFKLIVSYKKWKADKLYIKMAHVAYRENLISLSIKLLKMARFEKQTSFFFIYISKI